MSAALPPATQVTFCQASGYPRPTPAHMMPVIQHMRTLTPRSACASDQKFERIDANGDGVISREEWKKAAAMRSMTPRQPAQTMLVQPSQRQLHQPLNAVHPPMQHPVQPMACLPRQIHGQPIRHSFGTTYNQQQMTFQFQPRQSLPAKPVHAVEPLPIQSMQSGLHTLQLDTRVPHEQIAKRESSPPKRSPSPSKGSPGPQSNDKGSPRVTSPRGSFGRMTNTPNTRPRGLSSDRHEEALKKYLDRCQRARDQREQDSSLRITSLRREQWGLGGFHRTSSFSRPGGTVIGPPLSPGGASRTSPSPRCRARRSLTEDSVRRYCKDDRKTYVAEYFNEQEEMCLILPETIDESIKEVVILGEGNEVGDGETNTFVEPSKSAEFVGRDRGIEDSQVPPTCSCDCNHAPDAIFCRLCGLRLGLADQAWRDLKDPEELKSFSGFRCSSEGLDLNSDDEHKLYKSLGDVARDHSAKILHFGEIAAA